METMESEQPKEELMPYTKGVPEDPSASHRHEKSMNKVLLQNSQHGASDNSSPAVLSSKRRNSQDQFASKKQTIMVFDWDDTLFPTTWVRHYMGLHWKYPLDDQPINAVQKRKIKLALDELATEVETFITLALTKGHVVIVTLAKIPWVGLSCENFFPKIAKLIKDHDIRIVYAQEVQFNESDLPAPATDPESQEAYWTKKKQLAIQSEVEHFYSQYPGQSWKNVISIGDSDFERRATYDTMKSYQAQGQNELKISSSRGEEDLMCLSGVIGNHYRRLRIKTVKMYDSPRIKDLELEIQLLKKWLPSMISLDSGLDVDLEDDERLADTHRLLTGEVL